MGDRYLSFALYGGPLYLVDKLTGHAAGQFSSGSGFDAPPAIAGPAMAILSNAGWVYTLLLGD